MKQNRKAFEGRAVSGPQNIKRRVDMADTEKKSMSQRFAGLKTEFSKIIWPDGSSVGKQTVAVVATSVVVAFIIVILDYATKSA